MAEYDDDDGREEGKESWGGPSRVNNLNIAIQTSALARDKRRFHPPFAAHANARKSYSKSNHFNRKGCSTARKCKKSRRKKKKKKKSVDSAERRCVRPSEKAEVSFSKAREPRLVV